MNQEISPTKIRRKNNLPPCEAPYTVSELNYEIKKKIEQMGSVWLTGEVSGLKCHTSGHIYLTLKDKNSQIGALIWRSVAKNLKFSLKNGMELLVCGEITTYGPQSKYQIIINTVEPRGAGALQIAFEQMKQRLEEEGLFDKAKKKPLPYLPRKIAVVTSPTGAAIKDILNVIARRYPNVEIYILPARVQGEGAAKEIADMIRFANEEPSLADVEVLIVGRGGGSPEDLWAFNEEIVAYAIYHSQIPIISAVGHEIDLTISDLVADRRALTPTEAGELVLPRLDLLYEQLKYFRQRLDKSVFNRISMAKIQLSRLGTHRAFTRPLDRLRHIEQRLDMDTQRLKSGMEKWLNRYKVVLTRSSGQLMACEPSAKLQRFRQYLKEYKGRIQRANERQQELDRRRLTNIASQLEALSPLSVLRRGYSITYSYSGDSIIQEADEVEADERIWTRFANSWIRSRVEKTGTKTIRRVSEQHPQKP